MAMMKSSSTISTRIIHLWQAFRGGIRDGGLGKGQLALYGRDVNDDARTLLNHSRQERPIQAHGRKQIEVELPLPCLVVKHREPASRRRRAADDVDHDVNPAKALANSTGNGRAAFRTGHVCGNEHRIGRMIDARSRCGQDFGTGVSQPGNNSFTDTLGSAGDEGAKTAELEVPAHGRISSETIL